jgi:hypothetical protein
MDDVRRVAGVVIKRCRGGLLDRLLRIGSNLLRKTRAKGSMAARELLI